ncbi:MAG: DNA repair protein RadA [Acidobacteriota bacterium]|nr:DNA repair protein RadA [Blastocatellia bacterium]MDW8238639.1 DNA repair protein RadA [Acidobacteriota bacterium]
MAKGQKTVYSCQQCGYQSPKWLGKCPDCGEWNSFVEERPTYSPPDSAKRGQRLSGAVPVAYHQIESQDDVRVTSGIVEFDRVLGGGIVPGSLVLVGGDPGIGKSTLLLQVAEQLQSGGQTVLYVSGEESHRQIKMRGQRLGLRAERLYVLAETHLESVLIEVDKLNPAAMIIDSIQTVYSERLDSSPGSVSQLREAAAQLLMLAKSRNIPIFLIGHVTKEGMIAGPKALEHMVDTVLYFEGERHHNHRIIRAVKNRYGATNEVGIFEMTGRGLMPVINPSALFLSQRPKGVSGSIVVACMEGTRPILVELQALVSSSQYGTGRRMTQGVDQNRVALLIAVLEKRVGLHLLGEDVFVNVAGGITIDEPAIDLGIVAAISSSFKNIPLDPETVVFGEVGLAGEVRATSAAAIRLREVAALGFKRCLMPSINCSGLDPVDHVEIIGVRSVLDALDALF